MTGRVTTLGSLRIYQDETRVVSLGSQPLRCALLVCLAVEDEQTRDALMGRLWPEREPKRARHVLSQTVYELRKELGDEWVEGSGETLRIGEGIHVDTKEFERGVAEGHFVEALELYDGEFLQDTYLADTNPFELWVDHQRSRLRRLHRKARRDALAQVRSNGDPTMALAVARRWVELEPFDDEAQFRYVELLAETGRRTEALQHFEFYEKMLGAEEGQLEPLDELVQLVQRIRSGDFVKKRVLEEPMYVPEVRPDPAVPPTVVPSPATGRRAQTSQVAGPAPNTIAVLPFVNLSPEPGSDYFSDGITEELINVLAEMGDIQVAARTSSFAFKGNPLDVRQIGQNLNVRWVVEGCVRKAGEQLRISARLVSAVDGYPFWSGRYDREMKDVFQIQEELSRAIGEALSARVSAADEPLVKRQTENLEAYRLYLLGRYNWNRRTPDGLELAVRSFLDSIALAPAFAPAHAGLADTYVAQAQFGYCRPDDVLPLADAACKRALGLDDTLPELHTTRAHLLEVYDWDFVGAEREYQRAIALNPRDGNTRAFYAAMLVALRRFGDAAHHMKIGLQLEPFSLPMRFHHGMLLYRGRNVERAIPELMTAVEMSPTYFAAPVFLSLSHSAAGRPAEGVTIALNAIQKFGPNPALLMALGRAYGLLGALDDARAALTRIEEVAKHIYVPAVLRTIIYAAMGELDAAFEWLDRACDEHYGQLMFINVDPGFDPMRGDPRFASVTRRLGLG